MTITALPAAPSTADPANFNAKADAFIAALATFVTETNAVAVAMNLNSTTDTSVTSVLIGTGAKTFTVTAGKSFQPGMFLVFADTAAPSTNSMYGQITSYSGTTLIVNVSSVLGSGTKTAWTISQSSATMSVTTVPGSTVLRSIPSKLRDTVSVQDFGAVGDGVADDTTALQAALTWAMTNSKAVFLPDGIYDVTAALVIPLDVNGWSFVGSSIKGTRIRQRTNNTPVFTFSGGNNSNFEIGRFSVEYLTPQAAANTNARAFNFNITTSALYANYGIYNFIIHPLRILNACRGLYCGNPADGDTYNTTLWGVKIGLLIFEVVSGRHISFRGTDPNNCIEGPVYSINSAVGTEELFYFQNQDNIYIGSIEINNNFNGRTAFRFDQSRGVVNCIRQEIATYATTGGVFIQHSNAWLTFGSIRLLTTTFNVGAGVKFHIFNNSGSTGEIAVDDLQIESSTLTTGIPLVFYTGSVTNRLTLRKAPTLDVFSLSDVGTTTAANGLYIETWNIPATAADNGNISPTLTVSSEMIQPFSTTLTANRTVTLPNEFGTANISNLYNGKKFVILRNAATPGNFTLVIQANALLYTMPVNAKMCVEFTYARAAWVKTNEATLT